MPAARAQPTITTPDPDPNLRPHQVEAFRAVFDHLARGVDRQLCLIPTGGGKTYLAIAIARHFRRALFIVPRPELLKQSQDSYGDLNGGLAAGTIWRKRFDVDHHFTVATIQSLHGKLDRFRPDAFDLIVIDEAHHVLAKQWRETTEHFHPKLLLGLSATPERLDGAPLNSIFNLMSYQMDVRDAVERGILVRPKALQVHTDVSLDAIRRTAGKFDEKQLARLIDTPERNRLVVNTYLEHAADRSAVVFTAGVEHARHLAEHFQRRGITADSVAGKDRDRSDRIARFEAGTTRVLANAALLTEGWDYPPVSCILMARPTESRALYVQSIGRGLRLAEGKHDCLIVDFNDASRRHRLAGIWDFWGSRRRRENLDEPTDLLQRDRDHEDRLEHLAGTWNLNAYTEVVDLLEPPPDIDEFVLGAHVWHHKPATEKQLAALARNGYDISLDWTRGQASAVIGSRPASQAQRRLLLALGFDTVAYDWSYAEAKRALDGAQEEGRAPDWSVLNRLERRHPAPQGRLAQ